MSAVCESVRNVTAVGAKPVAITDCLCFGNPEKPEQMQDFVDAVRGIINACAAVSVSDSDATLPVIAGNVSLYNESANGAIPASPMISCLGVMPDVSKAITYDFKRPESLLLLVGERKDECGGSVYYQLFNVLGKQLPKPDLANFNREIAVVHALIQEDCVLACHDIADGGIAVSLAEMSFKNNIGVEVTVPGILSLAKKLFGETGGFILEIAKEKIKPARAILAKHSVASALIGQTSATAMLNINDVIAMPVELAKEKWTNGLRDKLI